MSLLVVHERNQLPASCVQQLTEKAIIVVITPDLLAKNALTLTVTKGTISNQSSSNFLYTIISIIGQMKLKKLIILPSPDEDCGSTSPLAAALGMSCLRVYKFSSSASLSIHILGKPSTAFEVLPNFNVRLHFNPDISLFIAKTMSIDGEPTTPIPSSSKRTIDQVSSPFESASKQIKTDLFPKRSSSLGFEPREYADQAENKKLQKPYLIWSNFEEPEEAKELEFPPSSLGSLYMMSSSLRPKIFGRQ
jgi:hypothetical protein